MLVTDSDMTGNIEVLETRLIAKKKLLNGKNDALKKDKKKTKKKN
jgi:hypothetical protein